MENFNTVPSQGKFGDSVAVVNENFLLAQQEMEILRNLISPDTKFVTAVATAQTTSVTQVLPATGSTDTVYRVGKWDGTQYDATVYSEYAWFGSQYKLLATKEYGIDTTPTAGSENLITSGAVAASIVYDISAAHSGAAYADLAAALGTNGSNVPDTVRKGGMSVKFIQGTAQSSDNKYVQARCMAQNFTTDVTQWQGVDDEPTVGSENLVKSGGVKGSTDDLFNGSYKIENYYTLNAGANLLTEVHMKAGVSYITTINFNEALTAGGWFSFVKKSDTSQSLSGVGLAANATTGTITYTAVEDVVALVRFSLITETSKNCTIIVTNNIPKGNTLANIGRVLNGRLSDIANTLTPSIAGAGTYSAATFDAIGLPIRSGNMTRLATPLYFFGGGKITISIGSGFQFSIQTWKLGVQLSNYGWTTSYTKELEGDFFSIHLRKTNDEPFTDETITDIGLTFTVSSLCPSVVPTKLLPILSNTINLANENREDIDNVIDKVTSFTPVLESYGQHIPNSWDYIGRPIISGGNVRMTSILYYLTGGRIRITIDNTKGYQWYLFVCKFGQVVFQHGWQYGVKEFDITDCDYFFFNFKRVVDGAEVPFTNETPEDMGFVVDVINPLMMSVTNNKTIDDIASEIDKGGNKENETSLNPFVNNPYWYHFNPTGFVKNGNGDDVIPSQSLADVDLAARLGFKFIEANVQKTLDNRYICIHGLYISATDQRFDSHVISLEGTDVTTINIREKTLAWIQEYIRYDSDVAKYRTTVPTLEEFCERCNENNIGLYMASSKDRESLDICRRYLGNNLIVGSMSKDTFREMYDGYGAEWVNYQCTKDWVVNFAKEVGKPFIMSLAPDQYTRFRNEGVLDDMIEELHQNNLLIGACPVYMTEEDSIDALKRGFDILGSGHEVNPFEHNYEMYDIDVDDFTGIASGGIISLSAEQSISCGSNTSIIGKGMLSIAFNGTLNINFGSIGSRVFESEGKEIVLSDFFYIRPTTLTITAVENTEITSLVYKTSKC